MGNLRKQFGTLVAAHRRRKGWTQHKLAEAADLSDDMVARIEIGGTGVSFRSIEKLASALEVEVAELFTAIPLGQDRNPPLGTLAVQLAGLSPAELNWLNEIIQAVLRKPS